MYKHNAYRSSSFLPSYLRLHNVIIVYFSAGIKIICKFNITFSSDSWAKNSPTYLLCELQVRISRHVFLTYTFWKNSGAGCECICLLHSNICSFVALHFEWVFMVKIALQLSSMLFFILQIGLCLFIYSVGSSGILDVLRNLMLRV